MDDYGWPWMMIRAQKNTRKSWENRDPVRPDLEPAFRATGSGRSFSDWNRMLRESPFNQVITKGGLPDVVWNIFSKGKYHHVSKPAAISCPAALHSQCQDWRQNQDLKFCEMECELMPNHIYEIKLDNLANEVRQSLKWLVSKCVSNQCEQ